MHFELEKMNDHFIKHHLRGFPFGATIHEITPGDLGEPHDHPYDFTSFIIQGWYVEKQYKIFGDFEYADAVLHRTTGNSYRVYANTVHQIAAVSPGGCWTIIVPGPKQREPGFYRFGESTILHRFWNEPDFKPYKH